MSLSYTVFALRNELIKRFVKIIVCDWTNKEQEGIRETKNATKIFVGKHEEK